MFVTVPQLQDYLWWANATAQDQAKMQLWLDAANGLIISFVGDLREQDYIEYINGCDIGCGCCSSVLFKHINVTSINSINNITYTGVENIDYRIKKPNNRKVEFLDLVQYPNTSRFCDNKFDYTAWYTANNIPSDLLYVQTVLAASEYNAQNGQPIKSYKLRQRTVSFAWTDELWNKVRTILWKYTTLSIYTVWGA